MVGRQAEAISTSGVMSRFLNTRARPVATLVDRPALHRTKATRFRDTAPKALQSIASAEVPVQGMSVNQRSGVHSACRGAGNSVDPQPRLFEETVEHTPGVR